MDTPDRDALRDAREAILGRHPDTPAAQAFADATLAALLPHLGRTRKLGEAGLSRLRQDLGTLLAAVMRPGLAGMPVRVHQSPSGSMWSDTPFGRDRCWAMLDALRGAGLVGVQPSVRTPGPNRNGRLFLTAAIWPTEALVAAAVAHGVTYATRKADWRADASALSGAVPVSDPQLVTCREAWDVPCAPGVATCPVLDEARRHLRTVNALNASATIRGAGHTTTLVRRFLHSAAFHGRFYAPVSTMSPEDRQRVTVNGEPVAEVDVRASQLTVLLGLSGQAEAPEDPYAAAGLPRAVVKGWVIQSLGSGAPATRWSRDNIRAAWGIKAGDVWTALRPTYPWLGDLGQFVPGAALASVPTADRGRAAGQWLVQREAAIIGRAMLDLVAAGVVVLPVHDSLVVPVSAVAAAQSALVDAFRALVGIVPRLTVDLPS